MGTEADCDLFVIGGGVNGCGIARDAAGRGLSVRLAEMHDLGSSTSSASTKLFHGGLRYLEHFEFRLVREALVEREVLLRAMPHISWPLRFVLPCSEIRNDDQAEGGKAGRRPAWMIRAGLFLYDHLGGRDLLRGTSSLDLQAAPEGAPLQRRFRRGYEYSDCWVDDSRLVVLNARDASARGTDILVQTEVVSAQRVDGSWEVVTTDSRNGECTTHRARALVNAAGPWVGKILQDRLRLPSGRNVRLVRGSHIVIPRLYDHEKCYILQGHDGRVIFTIPYERDFTLVGTTDAEHESPDQAPHCTPDELDYLLSVVNQHFAASLEAGHVVWSYSGIRPLLEDGTGNASAVTRDYSFEIDDSGGVPALSVFGGKITTYRRLAESAVDRLAPYFPSLPGRWTAGVALPGGNFAVGDVRKLVDELLVAYPFLSNRWAERLFRAYGTEATEILNGAKSVEDLGRTFCADLTATEIDWMIEREFARCASDILWRRSKLGLRATEAEVLDLEGYVAGRLTKKKVPAAALH